MRSTCLPADVALLTSVGLDHVEWLGDALEQIGREKAGIFRAGRPAVVADPQAPASVAAYARELPALLYGSGQEFSYRACRGKIGAGARLPRPGSSCRFRL